MPYVIGIVLSAGVAVFARVVGFDRDRAFYPTVMIVIACHYVARYIMALMCPAALCDGILDWVGDVRQPMPSTGT